MKRFLWIEKAVKSFVKCQFTAAPIVQAPKIEPKSMHPILRKILKQPHVSPEQQRRKKLQQTTLGPAILILCGHPHGQPR